MTYGVPVGVRDALLEAGATQQVPFSRFLSRPWAGFNWPGSKKTKKKKTRLNNHPRSPPVLFVVQLATATSDPNQAFYWQQKQAMAAAAGGGGSLQNLEPSRQLLGLARSFQVHAQCLHGVSLSLYLSAATLLH